VDEQDTAGRPSERDVDERLLSLLVCPACHQPVDKSDRLLVCRRCGVGYPVKNGIPVMLSSAAVRLGPGQPDSGAPEQPAGRND